MITYNFIVQHFSCTMKVMCKLNLLQTLSEALSDDICCDYYWTNKEVAVQCVPVEVASLLSCTLLGVKAVQWSILMHLFSENLLCSETSIRWLIVYLSALIRTLRVTAKALSCSWTRLRSCWVFLINKSLAIVLQIISNTGSVSIMCCESELITCL